MLPARASATISASMSSCFQEGPDGVLPTSTIRRLAAGELEDRRRHQPVVDDDVRLVQQAAGLEGQELGVARAGADEVDDARAAARVALGEHRARAPTGRPPRRPASASGPRSK